MIAFNEAQFNLETTEISDFLSQYFVFDVIEDLIYNYCT